MVPTKIAPRLSRRPPRPEADPTKSNASHDRRRGHRHDFWPCSGGYQCACGANRPECMRCAGVCAHEHDTLCSECVEFEDEDTE